MSREIKFRAWSNTENCYLIKGDNFGTTHDCDPLIYWMQGQDVILEQSTGQTDKNGVEIYEGDIVLFKGKNETCKKVVFEHGQFYPICDAIKYSRKIEIIGNIHEPTI